MIIITMKIGFGYSMLSRVHISSSVISNGMADELRPMDHQNGRNGVH